MYSFLKQNSVKRIADESSSECSDFAEPIKKPPKKILTSDSSSDENDSVRRLGEYGMIRKETRVGQETDKSTFGSKYGYFYFVLGF